MNASTPPAKPPIVKRDDKDDEEEEWRHEPIAPVDQPNPLRSLGEAVGETVTGSKPPAPDKR